MSAISGNAVTGASGAISGRRWIDGGATSLLSGNIVEDAGGHYHVNLHDFDLNGNNIGVLLTASGCVPVNFCVITDNNISGRVGIVSGTNVNVWSGQLSGHAPDLLSGRSFTASGINTVVPIASISGVQPISGTFVSVPIASISGVIANSGLNVTVPIATLSGVIANSGIFASVPIATISGVIANSGIFATVPIATISGVIANSGLNVTVPIGTISGTVVDFLSGNRVNTWDAGNVGTARSGVTARIQLATTAPSESGVLVGQQIDIVQGAGAGQSRIVMLYSGDGRWVDPDRPFVVSPDNTSIVAIRPSMAMTTSGQLSGQIVDLTSGRSFTASGINTIVPIASISGVIANSGLNVTVPIATLSGVIVNSGLFVTVPIASISGVIANSGLNVTVPIATLSGVIANSGLNVIVPIASLSGVIANSGLFTTVAIASISGTTVVVLSGTGSLLSGERDLIVNAILDKTETIESGTGTSGLTVRQALRGIAAATLGESSGFLSGITNATVRYQAGNTNTINRIIMRVDSFGNRSGATLNLA